MSETQGRFLLKRAALSACGRATTHCRHIANDLGLFRWLRLVLACLTVAIGGVSGLGQTNELKSGPAPVFAALLEYKEVPYEVASGWVKLTVPCVFNKEPALGTNRVVRGRLHLGESTNDFLPFAWAPRARKLYLDLNRNLDLTDDGEFSSPISRGNDWSQSFSNIVVSYPHTAGLKKYRVRLTFQDRGSEANVTVGFYSFWQGKITLREREYQVGIIEDPFPEFARHLLLRPWAEREGAFCARQGVWDAFGLEKNLFFENQRLRLETGVEPGDGVPRMKLAGYADTKETGKIQITGQFVRRLLLGQKEGTVAVVDSPRGEVEIPVGKYAWGQAILKAGDKAAYLSEDFVGTNFNVVAGKPLVLQLGGPLTNRVDVSAQKKLLRLTYRLVGVGNKRYTLAEEDRANPPRFKVYKGPQTLAAGRFEYG